MLNFRAASLLMTIAVLSGFPCRADPLGGTQLTSDLQILSADGLYTPATETLVEGATTTYTYSIPTVMTVKAAVNLSNYTLTLTDIVQGGQVPYSWIQTFTDSAFTNYYAALVSSNFPALPGFPNGLDASQTGTTMTFKWAGIATQVNVPTTFTATYNLVDPPSAPEPSTTLPLAGGLLAASWFARRRKSALGGPPAAH